MGLFRKHIQTESNTENLLRDIDRLFIVQDILKSVYKKNNFEEVAVEILNQIEQKMGYTGSSISIVDWKEETIQLKFFSTSVLSTLSKKYFLKKSSFDPIPLRTGVSTLTKLAALENKIYIDEDISKFTVPPLSLNTAKLIQNLSGIKCMVAIPIRSREDILGVLNFTLTKSKIDITTNELKTLELFIDQVGLIIDNVNKYEKISNFNNQLKVEIEKATQELSVELKNTKSLYNLTAKVSTSLDPYEVAQFAVDSLPQDEEMVGGALSKYDEDAKTLYVVTTTKNQLSYQVQKVIGEFSQYKLNILDQSPAVQQNVSWIAIKTAQPQFTNDISSYMAPVIPKQLVGVISGILNIKSLAVYPITSKGKVVGVITFFMKSKLAEELDDNEKRLLATYANQIGIAYENANVYKKLQETQHKLEVSLVQLEEARKHERDMIDIMGHELRTPISIARNALVMMDTQLKKDPNQFQQNMSNLLNMAVDSTRREVALIETLLTATKAEGKGFQLILEKINLLDIVQESLKGFENEAIKKGLKIVYTPPAEPIYVYADKTRAQEVADNFVSNAVKYTIKGNVEIALSKDVQYGYMAVKDSGIGIQENDLKRLGEKFFRARQYIDDKFATVLDQTNDSDKNSGEKTEVVRPGGTGLGLFVTFNLIKVLEGKLDIKSKVGEGSTFTFGLPIYNDQPVQQVERKAEKD